MTDEVRNADHHKQRLTRTADLAHVTIEVHRCRGHGYAVPGVARA